MESLLFTTPYGVDSVKGMVINMEKILKKQLLHQRIQTGLVGGMLLVLIIVGIYAVNTMKEINVVMVDARQAVNDLQTKVDSLHIDEINQIISQTNEILSQTKVTLDTMQTILGTMDEAVKKVDILLNDVKVVSDTINSVQEKVDNVTSIFQW